MGKYIALIDYTDRGVQAIEDSPSRSDAFLQQAAAMGVTVEKLYWTFGGHDGVIIVDGPDDETVAALFLSLGRAGAVRTQTLRAYDRDGMERILGRLTGDIGHDA